MSLIGIYNCRWINIEDLYTDYLIYQQKYATATGLSNILDGELSHDQITRFLQKEIKTSKDLWARVKPAVRKHEEADYGTLSFDDMIGDKNYTDENDIIAWHYDHSKGRNIKGINIITALLRYKDINLPIAFEIIKKTSSYCDVETKQVRRKSEVTKNEMLQAMFLVALKNMVKFKYVLMDSWFGCKENMELIENNGKKFIAGIKSNRLVALTGKDKRLGNFQDIKSIDLKDSIPQTVYLRGLPFEVQILKKVFTNENGTTGVLYLVTNDLNIDGEEILEIYKRRWSIEEYHKSVKQNSSFEKSPTRTVKSQSNHVFFSLLGYCKLELLKIKKTTNHFALKAKMLFKANLAAREVLSEMNGDTAFG